MQRLDLNSLKNLTPLQPGSECALTARGRGQLLEDWGTIDTPHMSEHDALDVEEFLTSWTENLDDAPKERSL